MSCKAASKKTSGGKGGSKRSHKTKTENCGRDAEMTESDSSHSDETEHSSDEYTSAGDHSERMRQMDQMFHSSFFGGSSGLLGVEDGRRGARVDRRSEHHQRRQQQREQQLSHRNHMMDPFVHFDSMFSNMRSMVADLHKSFDQQSSNSGGHMFQQSSFFSSSNMGGEGGPKVFQATSSVRQGPGGVKETRKAVRDSESGMERVSMGHHIQDRAHIIERSRNQRTGQTNQNQEFINLDEEEAPAFDREYQERWNRSNVLPSVEQRRRRLRDQTERHSHRPAPRGLPEPESTRRTRKSLHSHRE